jgi:hypothetical protein
MDKVIMIELDKPRELRLGYKAQLEIESLLDTPFLRINFGNLKLEELTKVIYCSLKEREESMTTEKLIDLIDEHSDSIEVIKIVDKLVAETFGLNGDENKKKK